MTIPLVQQAIIQGYSIKKIIDWLIKSKSKLGIDISEAMRQGYSENAIEEYLKRSSGMPFSAKNKAIPSITEEEKARGILYKGSPAQRGIGNVIKTAAVAAPIAAAAGGAYALAPMLSSVLGRAAPQLMQTAVQQFPALAPLFGQMGQGAPGNAPSPAMPSAQTITQPQAQPAQAPIMPAPIMPAPIMPAPIMPAPAVGSATGNILDSFMSSPMGQLVKNVSSQYQDVPTVSGIIRHFFDKDVKRFEKSSGVKLEDVLSQILDKLGNNIASESQEQNALASQIPPEMESPIASREMQKGLNLPSDESERMGIASKEEPLLGPSNKTTTVSSPKGIGTVVANRNGKALIDVGGKKFQVDEDDLEQEPEEIKRAEIVIRPEEIPENLRSAALGFVSVPKSRRDIDIMYGPSGKFYRYYRKDGKPIPDDVIEKLREGQTMPISSGDTYMGAFDASVADSRGTVAYHDLKARAQNKEAVEKGMMRKGRLVKEENDPEKELWYEELESPFIHGFIEQFLKTLTTRSHEYQKAKKAKK